METFLNLVKLKNYSIGKIKCMYSLWHTVNMILTIVGMIWAIFKVQSEIREM